MEHLTLIGAANCRLDDDGLYPNKEINIHRVDSDKNSLKLNIALKPVWQIRFDPGNVRYPYV